MKKFTKAILMISFLLFLTGAGCIIAGYVMGVTSGDFTENLKQFLFIDLDRMTIFTEEGVQIPWNENEEEAIRNTWNYKKDEVDKLILDLSSVNCRISLSEDEQMKINSSRASGIEIENRNGTLRIEKSVRVFKDHNERIDIYLPVDMEFELFELRAGIGNIVIECPIQADIFEVEAAGSAIYMNQMIRTREFDLELGAGKTEIKFLDARDIQINNAAGQTNMSLYGQKESYCVTIESAVGDVQYGEKLFSGIANTYQDNPKDADRKIEIESSLGEVNITFEEVI